MASRVIHYLIATKIAESEGLDKDRFIIGALLPDLSKHEDGSYDRAHFGQEIKELGLKGINWKNYKQKYNDRMKTDALYLGYYCHLIMDALWFSMIVDRYIRIYPYPERKNIYQKSYRDYEKLNYLLTKEFNLKYCLQIVEDIDIDEIDLSLFSTFFIGLKNEIKNSEVAEKRLLELYPYDVIIEYITNTINFCSKEICAFYEGRESVNPEVFYVRV